MNQSNLELADALDSHKIASFRVERLVHHGKRSFAQLFSNLELTDLRSRRNLCERRIFRSFFFFFSFFFSFVVPSSLEAAALLLQLLGLLPGRGLLVI
jgi:hypothetical protein